MIDDPIVHSQHLTAILEIDRRRLPDRIQKGRVPNPDISGGGMKQFRLWKLSTIRAWNPEIADRVVLLLNPAETAK